MTEPEVDDYAARNICTGCYMEFDYKGECPECESKEEEEEDDNEYPNEDEEVIWGLVTFGPNNEFSHERELVAKEDRHIDADS